MHIRHEGWGIVWKRSLVTALFAASYSGCTTGFENCAETRSCPPKEMQKEAGSDETSGGASGVNAGGSGNRGGASGQINGGNGGSAVGAGGSGTAGGSAAGASAHDGGSAGSGDVPEGGNGTPDAATDASFPDAGDAGPIVCAAGFLDCNHRASDGCEVDARSNPDHCGSCDITCATLGTSARACTAGLCKPTCDTTHLDCNGDGKDGCEVDGQTDAANCGACKYACSKNHASATSCVKGACTPVCAANFAECGRPAPAPDDGCETDLTKPESCGACGHNCLGSTCTNKKCDPIYLASGRETPRAIVVDANYVHWVEGGTTNGAVLRMPRNGTAITQVASNQALPLDIATDGQFIYWCNALSGSTAIKIQEIGTIGNGTSLSVIDPSKLASPCPIAVNGGSIYWFDYNLRQTFYTSLEIGFVIALSPPVGYPSTELYVDSTNVYFAPGDAEYAPLDFSQSTTALSFPGSSGVSIAIDATYVYYTTGATSNGLARRAKNLSGTEQPIASSISGTISNAMTTDANFLYYAAGTTLYKVPKAGGTPVPLSTAVDGMVDIVANGDALYWVNRGDQNGGKTGSIVKLAL